VLAASFLARNPGSRFATLLIDDRDHSTVDEPFEVVHLDHLLHEPAKLHLLAAYYDVMELATAVKPLLLLHLLRTSGLPVVYLDPDIEVYDDFTPVTEGLLRAPIVLTPHTLHPYPRDGLRPTEAEILGAGAYNLGFIGVREGAEEFLRWWWERLQRDAIVDPARMLFTDQRWIDFVPGLYQHELLKDPGLNVAYWNLHARTLARGSNGYLVNGHHLRFFHFSGYSPFRPDVLSKHTGDHPRVRLSDSRVLAELVHRYGEHLLAAGLTRSGGPEYGWQSADGDVLLDAPARRAYRHAVLAADAGRADPPPDPFAPGGGYALLRWLGEPVPGHIWPRASRYLQALHEIRPDLQRAFPQSSRQAEEQYLEWARNGSLGDQRPEHELRLLTGATSPAGPPVAVSDTGGLPSVHVVGYFRAELGMGEYGRQLLEAVRSAGADASTTTFTETVSRQQHAFDDQVAQRPAQVNLLVVNADQTPVFAQAVRPDFFSGRYTVGAWAWEVEHFPADLGRAFDVVDEVWAISSFTRDAIARMTDRPVFAVPPPVSTPVVDPAITREALGLPPGFVFLFAFDYLSVPKRKNAIGLVDAFTSAFRPGEGPTLVIKSINGDRHRAAQQELRRAVSAREDIVLMEDYLSTSERTSLMAHADCYVSLHRAEGFGLTMAESMALGKPVIATAYSGNMDFMTESTAYLVPWESTAIGEDAPPYPATARWAEPRLDVAAELMRRVYGDPEAAKQVGERAAAHIAEHHSPDARAALVRERLVDLSARLPAGATSGDTVPEQVASLSSLDRRLRRARFLLHVARTPERRRAAVRRRLGGVLSTRLGHYRRALAVQEAMHREVLTLRGLLQQVAGELDQTNRRITQLSSGQDQAGRALAEMSDGLERADGRVGELAELVDRLTVQSHALQARDDALVGQVDTANGELRLLRRRVDELGSRADDLAARVDVLREELEAAPYVSDPDLLRVRTGEGTTLGYSGEAGSSYAEFEDLFRGTEEFMRERQRAYLPLLADAGPVLDLGCGRGEVLAVLTAAGVEAQGVDLDASMVERGRQQGLPVFQGDALAVLARAEPGSLGAVTSFQVVEHLELADLESLFTAAHRALREDGLLVAETVNPHSPRALKAFWLDLTHRHPIYPEAAVMLAKRAGFRSAHVFFPHGSGDYEADRTRQGEYALVAVR
jgi:glycosyltransferase involved in cell wall biosynthesis/SAM-dependent methyltransferase